MTGIFISYRRADSEGYVGRIFDHLAKRFDPRNLFLDVESIEAGADFASVIEAALDHCGVCIAVIGPHWLDAADSRGRRRLEQPDDSVRLEIATALRRDLHLIPALVQGAHLPVASELPEDLVLLTRRNCIEISHERFDYDVERLVKAIGGAYGRVAVAYVAGVSSPVLPAQDTDVFIDGVRKGRLAEVHAEENMSADRHPPSLRQWEPGWLLSRNPVRFGTAPIRVEEGRHTVDVRMTGRYVSRPLAFRVRGGETLVFALHIERETHPWGQFKGYRLTLEQLLT